MLNIPLLFPYFLIIPYYMWMKIIENALFEDWKFLDWHTWVAGSCFCRRTGSGGAAVALPAGEGGAFGFAASGAARVERFLFGFLFCGDVEFCLVDTVIFVEALEPFWFFSFMASTASDQWKNHTTSSTSRKIHHMVMIVQPPSAMAH